MPFLISTQMAFASKLLLNLLSHHLRYQSDEKMHFDHDEKFDVCVYKHQHHNKSSARVCESKFHSKLEAL